MNYQKVILATFLCVIVLASTYLYSSNFVKGDKETVAQLSAELGSSKDLAVKKLKEKNEAMQARLKNFKKLRTKSHSAYFLSILPALFPPGTWISDLSLSYDDSRALGNVKDGEKTYSTELKIVGFAYLDDPNQQFGLVNDLLNNLNTDEKFKSFFPAINLNTVKAQNLQGFNVTRFEITCNDQ